MLLDPVIMRAQSPPFARSRISLYLSDTFQSFCMSLLLLLIVNNFFSELFNWLVISVYTISESLITNILYVTL